MKDNILRTARQFRLAFDPRARVLYDIAKQVFLDRNAARYPPDDRAEIKAVIRPRFLLALEHLQKARNALVAGKIGIYESERDRARMYMAHAATKRAEVYAQREGNRRVAFGNRSPEGVEGRADARLDKFPDGDELDRVIRAALEKNEKPPVNEWAEAYKLHRASVYRRIERIERARKK